MRATLPCGDCGRRIAWWSSELEQRQWSAMTTGEPRWPDFPWAPVGQPLGWAWQGKEPPFRWREEEVDVRCRSCHWTHTYSTRDLMRSMVA